MFKRKIESNLLEWKGKDNRRPLVIRGARQTGKTTIIREFSKSFVNYVELNLEKDSVQRIFYEVTDAKEVIKSIESISGKKIIPGETLLFLDEIQNSISAIKMLRFFYEEVSNLHVISAGSLLEVRMKKEGWTFPVGRVEFLYLYPLTFEEFLKALGEDVLLENLRGGDYYKNIPLSVHEKLLNLTADYLVIGGMPGSIKEYAGKQSFISVREYQENLINSFKEDFAKYSKHSEVEYLKQLWDKIPFLIGKRIQYSKLSETDSGRKGIAGAFDILHEAMLSERILPTVATMPPLVRKQKSAPKALYLDIGLCTCALKLTRDQIKEKIIDPFYHGALFEAFAGQELLAMDFHNRNTLYFWVREEKNSCSELDFLARSGEKLIPIEVKSGSKGSLRSLQQFLYRSGLNFGVRLYNGQFRENECETILPDGKVVKYKLLSLPFYMMFRFFAGWFN